MTEEGPADLALYLHWPYCARICPYCDFNVVRDRGRSEQQAALIGAMGADLTEQALRLGPRRLVSIFFGGGTPSLMPPEAVAELIGRARSLFDADGPVEVTLEANPTDAEAQRFAALAEAGVQRLSLGLQSLDDRALARLGRNHDAAAGLRAAEAALAVFPRVSADLIYAWPGQDEPAWAEELARVADLGFEHVSPYQLTIEAGTAFGRAHARGQLVMPDEDQALALYSTTQRVLQARGFDAYEVSNHARGPGARSRHNLTVWRGHEYLGVGPGAHGRIDLGGVRQATAAHRAIGDYIEAVRQTGVGWAEVEPVEGRARLEEAVLLGLRTSEGVDIGQFEALGVMSRVDDLVDEGFLTLSGRRVAATAQGRPLLDAMLSRLLT